MIGDGLKLLKIEVGLLIQHTSLTCRRYLQMTSRRWWPLALSISLIEAATTEIVVTLQQPAVTTAADANAARRPSRLEGSSSFGSCSSSLPLLVRGLSFLSG
jgi:hypothetical protein